MDVNHFLSGESVQSLYKEESDGEDDSERAESEVGDSEEEFSSTEPGGVGEDE